jgi:hypothetical protein
MCIELVSRDCFLNPPNGDGDQKAQQQIIHEFYNGRFGDCSRAFHGIFPLFTGDAF